VRSGVSKSIYRFILIIPKKKLFDILENFSCKVIWERGIVLLAGVNV
jgi:hypothetical protein